MTVTEEDGDDVDSSLSDAKKAKKERKERRKERRERKEKRREKGWKEKASSDSESEADDSISREKKRRKSKGDKSAASTPLESSTFTPGGSGTSTPVPTSIRFLSRQKYIAQKRMAFADPAALNELCLTDHGVNAANALLRQSSGPASQVFEVGKKHGVGLLDDFYMTLGHGPRPSEVLVGFNWHAP
ncbi:hypothetical protein B0H63DRAFT_565011 [Podospora didyma]|uniref:Uncharacterized protein n=1 Tax=Podospora didyma TaxID=330526 RepID=A0AAE0K2L4_9PEZI|nr:hypothetical protein B0H63DRAFT_565011 [Podospora didyma]